MRTSPMSGVLGALLLSGLTGCFEGPQEVTGQRIPRATERAQTPPPRAELPDGHYPGDGHDHGDGHVHGDDCDHGDEGQHKSSNELPYGHPPIDGRPAGHPTLDGRPPGHPTLQGGHGADPHAHGHGGQPRTAATGEPLLAGEVELAGELAGVREGRVFLVVRRPGQGGSLVVGHVDVTGDIDDPAAPRLLGFELTDQDTNVPLAQLPPELELHLYYDPDGIVETQEGRVGKTLQVRRGELGLRVVLDPAAAGQDS